MLHQMQRKMRSTMSKHRRFIVLYAISLALLGCASRIQPTPPPTSPTQLPAKPEIKLTSSAFTYGQLIPRQYTCDGVNVSPPLEWSGVPKAAKTLALIVDDPDAPGGVWVHWVLYNLPAENIGLVENVPLTENLKAGGFQGKNDFDKIGYGGPCPPTGTHRYLFKIYALDSELNLKAAATKADLLKAMEGHILLQGQLVGTYQKQSAL
jgi:Raf kinase inhibitor-like YbhB/YbcL family protein